MLTPKEFKITMLGARGAGKTSVLAAIYDTFQRLVTDLYLELLPDPQTRITLSDCLKDLQSSLENLRIGGYSGGTAMRTYEFKLAIPGKRADLKMSFRDYPGEWIHQKPDEIIRYIQESDVVLWAIDAAAMMEKSAQYDEEFNRTSLIDGFLQTALHQLPPNQKKLILLVLIKSETYMQRSEDIKKLLRTTEERHNGFIETVKRANQDEERFALAITSIQTLGKVRFSHIDVENDAPVFVHVRTSKQNAYQPKHVEQVLHYCMPFILRRYMENLSVIDRIIHIFTGNPCKDFGAAIKKLAEQRIESEKEGFKVLQGRSLFNPPES